MRRLRVRGVLGVGLGVALAHLTIALTGPPAPTFDKYGLAARTRLAGELPGERLVDFSPLYLELMTLLERTVPDPAAVLRVLQWAATATAVVALGLWLRTRLPRGILVVVLLLFALDRQVLVYQRVLEPEILLVAFTAVWLAAVGRAPGLAGVSAALAVATRPTVLPVVLLGPISARLRRGQWESPGRLLAQIGPVAAVLLLLAARIGLATGSLAPAMNPGTVFFEGNQPLSAGTSAVYPRSVLELQDSLGGEISDGAHVAYRQVARAENRSWTPAEVNRFWAARGRAWLRDRPAEALRRATEKLRRACHSFAWHDVEAAWRYDRFLALPRVPFGILAALALVGAIGEVRRWRRSLLAYGLFASQLAVQVVFYTSPRQRILWLPALVFFAGRALARRGGTPGARRTGAVLLVIVLAAASLLPDMATLDERHRRLGELEATQRMVEIRRRTTEGLPVASQMSELVDALAAAPWWMEPLQLAFVPREDRPLEARVADRLEERGARTPAERFDLARVSMLAGRQERARELFLGLLEDEGDRPVYRKGRHPSSVSFHLARLARARGDLEEVRERLADALRENPGDPWVLAELAVVAGDAGARARLERWWGPVDAGLFLGRAHLAAGEDREAAAILGPLVRRLPALREVRLDLAVALGRAGELDAAVAEVLAASRQGIEPIRRPREIAEVARRWWERAPHDVRRTVLAAQILAGAGRLSEASDLLDGLRDVPVQDPELVRELDRTRTLVETSLGASAAEP